MPSYGDNSRKKVLLKSSWQLSICHGSLILGIRKPSYVQLEATASPAGCLIPAPLRASSKPIQASKWGVLTMSEIKGAKVLI